MKRSLTLTLMAIAGVAIIAVALVGFRLSQGGMNYSAYAHISDWPVADGTNDVHLEIDMVKDGTSWCNPVDTTAQNPIGGQYQVAVCLTSAPTSAAGFQFQLLYDDTLNYCVPVAHLGTDLDGNPDANVGTSAFTTPDLGPAANWDCAGAGGLNPPKCDANTAESGPGKGVATIACGAASDPYTLPAGATSSSPVAVVTFRALAAGVDNLTLSGGKAIDADLLTMIECPTGNEYCIGASDLKVAPPTNTPLPPTNTPLPATNTPVPPTATNTPAGVQMVKDANVLLPGIQDTNNLFLMAGGCVVAAEGKGCLVIDVSVLGAFDIDNLNDSDEIPEGLGAWEHQIRYDHKIVRLTPVPDNTWLLSGGRWSPLCTVQILSENWILEGCVSKDDFNNPGQQPGPIGSGLIERIYVQPLLQDLIYRSDFRPTKDNGVITDILDDNCEVTDTQAEAIPGTDAGGLIPPLLCTDVHITVRMLEGDIDLDCDVDVFDDQALAFRYGSQFGLQLYDRWFDLEPRWSDDDIDIKDLQFVFGRNYSTCQAPIPDDQAIPVGGTTPNPPPATPTTAATATPPPTATPVATSTPTDTPTPTATPIPPSGSFDSDGVMIHYETFGEEGEPIILVHGFLGSIQGDWSDAGYTDLLVESGRKVIAMDVRGFGQSGKPHDPEDYSVNKMGQDVVNLMDYLGIEKADLMGYSMGSFISSWVLIHHQDRLNSVVLGGTGSNMEENDPATAQMIYDALMADDPSTITDPNMKLLRFYVDYMIPGADRIAIAACAIKFFPLSEHYVASDFAGVTIPVLIINGADDPAASNVGDLVAAIPGVTYVQIPGGDHGTVRTLPAFWDAVLAFLAAH